MNNVDISTLLASSIHESKNRISTMLYQLQHVKEGFQGPESGMQNIEKIEESLKQLNDEWVEYLYLYRLASDGYELHPDMWQLEEFLDDQVFALAPSAVAKGLTLDYKCDPELVGVFDERLMTSVISTAVYNALRYAKKNILLSAIRQENYLMLAVEDDGPGFAEQHKEEEEALDERLPFQSTNTGLGLYFAELSAKAHSLGENTGFIEKKRSPGLGGAQLLIFIPQ